MFDTPRLKPERIRRLYRAARRGACDEQLLLDVGWSLHALCEEVTTAVTGLSLGEAACPACAAPVQRPSIAVPTAAQRRALFDTPERMGWFHCEHCQQRLLWQDCRDALRQAPRCFDCDRQLRRSGDDQTCTCGATWTWRAYRDSLSRRLRLPCPHCRQVLHRPKLAPVVTADSRAVPTAASCSCCAADMVRDGALLVCSACGHQVQWRSYRKGQKRRDETLTCNACGHAFGWQAWRQRAQRYSTGNPAPAHDFAQRWPACKSIDERLMRIDLLIQAIHGQGALAPVFIEGTKQGIRRLLDELAEGA